MGATYMSFGTGTFHVDGDDPLTQDQVDSVWHHLPTTGAGWVERGHLYVQQYDGAKVFDLGPVAPGVKGVSDDTRFGKKKPKHATKKKAVTARRAHAEKKSSRELQRDIDEVLAKPSGRSVPDITLRPAADETYAVLPVPSTDAIRVRLRRAGIGHFLGFDPKNAADRAEIERRIAEHVGKDLTVAWDQRQASRSHATKWAGGHGEITSTAGLMKIASAVARELKQSGMTWGDTSRAQGRAVRIWSSGTSVRFEVPARFQGVPSDAQAIVELHLVGPDRSKTSVGPFAGDMHYDKRFGEAMEQRVRQVLKKGVR